MAKHITLMLLALPLAGSLRQPARRAIASRRALLAGAPALVALTPGAALADPSLLSTVQGPLQDAVAPGHWLGQFVGLNSRTERWEFAASPGDVSAALVAVLDELTPERRAKLLIPEFRVARADSNNVHVLTWTKAEWLDSLDVRLEPLSKGTAATASFYATGFFPTSLPLAPLLNVGMAWLPSRRRAPATRCPRRSGCAR